MTESEPKRPPPPKSYVPLVLLEDQPTPILPPRPQIEGDGQSASQSPVPERPERRKNKKGVPPSPAPYIAPVTTKAEEETSANSVKPSSPKTSPRRSRSRSSDSIDGPQPTYAPPDTLIDSLYTEVRKPVRYPAPSMPAPPPPSFKENGQSMETSKRGNITSFVESAQSKSGTRPGRPPSRPARPPAANSPSGVSNPVSSAPFQTQHTTPASKPPPTKSRKRPEITVVNAQPMSGDLIPSPPTSPKYDEPKPSPPRTRKQVPPRKPVHGDSPSSQAPSPSRPPAQPPTSRPTPATRQPSQTSPISPKKAPPVKPAPFVDRKTPSTSSKAPPPRPVGRPAPQPTARSNKKVPVPSPGPPPDEEPPELPSDEEENEQKFKTEKQPISSYEQFTAQEEAVKEPTLDSEPPKASKRHSKFTKPTELTEETTQAPQPTKRAPPPRPLSSVTPHHQLSKDLVPEIESKTNAPTPKRPPSVKRPPASRPSKPLSKETEEPEKSTNGGEKVSSQPIKPKRTKKYPPEAVKDKSQENNDVSFPEEKLSEARDNIQDGTIKPQRSPSVSRPPPPRSRDKSISKKNEIPTQGTAGNQQLKEKVGTSSSTDNTESKQPSIRRPTLTRPPIPKEQKAEPKEDKPSETLSQETFKESTALSEPKEEKKAAPKRPSAVRPPPPGGKRPPRPKSRQLESTEQLIKEKPSVADTVKNTEDVTKDIHSSPENKKEKKAAPKRPPMARPPPPGKRSSVSAKAEPTDEESTEPPAKEEHSDKRNVIEKLANESAEIDHSESVEFPSEYASKDERPLLDHKKEKKAAPKRPQVARPPPPGKRSSVSKKIESQGEELPAKDIVETLPEPAEHLPSEEAGIKSEQPEIKAFEVRSEGTPIVDQPSPPGKTSPKLLPNKKEQDNFIAQKPGPKRPSPHEEPVRPNIAPKKPPIKRPPPPSLSKTQIEASEQQAESKVNNERIGKVAEESTLTEGVHVNTEGKEDIPSPVTAAQVKAKKAGEDKEPVDNQESFTKALSKTEDNTEAQKDSLLISEVKVKEMKQIEQDITLNATSPDSPPCLKSPSPAETSPLHSPPSLKSPPPSPIEGTASSPPLSPPPFVPPPPLNSKPNTVESSAMKSPTSPNPLTLAKSPTRSKPPPPIKAKPPSFKRKENAEALKSPTGFKLPPPPATLKHKVREGAAVGKSHPLPLVKPISEKPDGPSLQESVSKETPNSPSKVKQDEHQPSSEQRTPTPKPPVVALLPPSTDLPFIKRPPLPSAESLNVSEESKPPQEQDSPDETGKQPPVPRPPPPAPSPPVKRPPPPSVESLNVLEEIEISEQKSAKGFADETKQPHPIRKPPPPGKPSPELPVKHPSLLSIESQKAQPPQDNKPVEKIVRKPPPVSRPPPPGKSSPKLSVKSDYSQKPETKAVTTDQSSTSMGGELLAQNEQHSSTGEHTQSSTTGQPSMQEPEPQPNQLDEEPDVLEVEQQEPTEGHDVVESAVAVGEPIERSSKLHKSVSGSSKSTSSVHKKREEEGGIRIIRYDKKESSYEDSGVTFRQKSSRPKPPRPISMPPERSTPPTTGMAKTKPSMTTESIPEKAEKSKPPRPGPPPSNKGHSSKPPAKPPPAKKIPAGSRPAGGKPTSTSKDPSNPPQLPPRPTPGHPLYKYVCSEPHGLAITHYESYAEDELSYMEDDVIELIEKMDDNWYYARNADMDMQEGLVLIKNLKIIKKLPGSNLVKGFEEGPCAVAMHAFDAQSMDELSFNSGDLIMLKARVGDDWLRGKLINGAEGIFPRSYVEIVEDLPPNAPNETPQHTTIAESTVDNREPHCVALHLFNAEGPDELSLSPGDTISLVSRDGKWLRGKLRGKEGIFPANFVEVKVDLSSEQPKPEKKTGDSFMATAMFDYDGQDGDLSFKAGEKIKLLGRVNEEWVFGELAGKKGMLPSGFIDSNPNTLPPYVESTKDSSAANEVTGQCEALFDFDGDVAGGELMFKAGDVITTTAWVDDEWIQGRIGNKMGMFPVNFVKIIKELPKSSNSDLAKPPSSIKLDNKTHITDDLMPKAIALYDYDAGNSNEISFKNGDTLFLLTRVNNDWYEGENTRTGTFGQFPANFVNVVVPLP